MQFRFELRGRSKNTIHDISEKAKSRAQRNPAQDAQRQYQSGLRFALTLGGEAGEITRASDMGNDSC